MNIYDYYTQQSKTTDPGKYISYYNVLPDAIPTLCKTIHGLIMHYADEELHQYKIPRHRYREMNIRYVEKQLELLITRNDSSLDVPRSIENKLIGVCRDTSTLLCSILRYKKIPARLRSGFSNYFLPDMYLDGICVEYWNRKKNKWCLVDTRTTSELIAKYKININFRLDDLTDEQVITAPRAWQLCRSNKTNALKFGSRHYRGLWYVKNRLLQDFVLMLNKEVLIWDLWGMMLSEDEKIPIHLDEFQLTLLDELCEFLTKNLYNIDALYKFYEDNAHLRVPSTVLTCNPFIEPEDVAITI